LDSSIFLSGVCRSEQVDIGALDPKWVWGPGCGVVQDEDSKWSLKKVVETKRGIFTLVFEALALLGMLPFLVSAPANPDAQKDAVQNWLSRIGMWNQQGKCIWLYYTSRSIAFTDRDFVYHSGPPPPRVDFQKRLIDTAKYAVLCSSSSFAPPRNMA